MNSRPRSERAEGEYFLAAGALMAGLGVAAGAFGAHLLKGRLDADNLEVWKTASSYQMYHGLALIVSARLLARHSTRLFRIACGLFLIGIVLFSGSLYLIALTDQNSIGLITPLGGAAFLGAWACLAVGALRTSRP